jgi:hypothetical protein
LGKRGDSGAKGSGKGLGLLVHDGNRQKRGLVVVDGQTSGHFKQMEDVFGSSNSSRGGTEKDERVVGVLENWTGAILEDWMADINSKRMVPKQSTKHVSNNNEEIG